MSIIERAFEKLGPIKEKLSQPPESAEQSRANDGGARPSLNEVSALEDTVVDASSTSPSPLEAATRTGETRAEISAPTTGAAAESQPRTLREVHLDLDALAAAGMVTPHSGHTIVAEQYRVIKRPLLTKAAPEPEAGGVPRGNLIMVTSALPGEGKTFTSVNLAISMAMELDRTVLLVDTDVAKSAVTRMLGIQVVDGLTDYLTTPDLPLSDVLIKTNVPKLTVLPAGREHTNVTELLASDEMRRLTNELSTRYRDRVVVFDSSPLLATSGSTVLAEMVGQIVFVVQAERTVKSAVKEALKQISGHENIGLVFNRSRQQQGQYRYGYGYGYGYGGR